MAWPPHTSEERAYCSQVRGSKADRMLSSIHVSIPLRIAEIKAPCPTKKQAEKIQEAAARVNALVNHYDFDMLTPFRAFMIRSESVASSRIESIGTRRVDFAKAHLGQKTNENARLTYASVEATEYLTDAVRVSQGFTVDSILEAHRRLLMHDSRDAHHAGKLREEQNWIGGSDESPRNAIYVPPPCELVPGLLEDLVAFCNRDDMNLLVQTAIAHAHFESIHGFVDGKGRIGRSLITAMLNKNSPLEQSLILPFSSAMLADIPAYYAVLDQYREGDVAGVIDYFLDCLLEVFPAVDSALVQLTQVTDLLYGKAKVRKNSAASRMIPQLVTNPIFDAEQAEKMLDVEKANVYRVLSTLEERGVIKPVSQAKRSLSWYVPAVFEEIESMMADIGVRKVFDD